MLLPRSRLHVALLAVLCAACPINPGDDDAAMTSDAALILSDAGSDPDANLAGDACPIPDAAVLLHDTPDSGLVRRTFR